MINKTSRLAVLLVLIILAASIPACSNSKNPMDLPIQAPDIQALEERMKVLEKSVTQQQYKSFMKAMFTISMDTMVRNSEGLAGLEGEAEKKKMEELNREFVGRINGQTPKDIIHMAVKIEKDNAQQ